MTLGRFKRVTAGDAARRFAEVNDSALKEPVVVTRNGRARTVLLSVEAFERLLANERSVFLAKDTPQIFDAQLDAIAERDFPAAGVTPKARPSDRLTPLQFPPFRRPAGRPVSSARCPVPLRSCRRRHWRKAACSNNARRYRAACTEWSRLSAPPRRCATRRQRWLRT